MSKKKPWHTMITGWSSDDLAKAGYSQYNGGGVLANGYPVHRVPPDHTVRQGRQLPMVPGTNQSKVLLNQRSLPEDYSDSYMRETHSSKLNSYLRPFVPIKPSSLPFRQSLQTNGGHNYSASGPNKGTTWAVPPDHFPLPFAQQFQFPKLSDSPTTDHHRTLPPGRNISQRTLPQPPTSTHLPLKAPASANNYGIP